MPEDENTADLHKFRAFFSTEPADAAYAKLENWVFEETAAPPETARRIGVARNVLLNRNGFHDREHQMWVDPLLAKIATDASGNWQALKEAGLLLKDSSLISQGGIIDGQFRRGWRSGGTTRYSDDSDHFRAIQFFQNAISHCKKSIDSGTATPGDLAEIYLLLADSLPDPNKPSSHYLTDLDNPPELSTRPHGFLWNRNPEDFLVDGRSPALGQDDEIDLPASPASFDAAPSDLARQRWLIEEASRISPGHSAQARLKHAMLWESWLGVDQLASAGYIYIEGTESETDPNAQGEFELHTLKADETLLVSSNGPKRVTIPPGFRSIEILEELIDDAEAPADVRINAYQYLIDVLCDRRQFTRCEMLANELLQRFPDNESAGHVAGDFLENIVPDGNFLNSGTHPTGREIEVIFHSRNIKSLPLELWQLDVHRTVTDPEAWHAILRHGLSTYHGSSYSERERDALLPFYKRINLWAAPIRLSPNHLFSQSHISVPITEAGHYLLITRGHGMTRGLKIIVEDTLLVGTAIDAHAGANYLLLDASTGQPVTDAEVTLLAGCARITTSPDHLGTFHHDADMPVIIIRRPGRPMEIKASVEARIRQDSLVKNGEAGTLLVTNQPLYRSGQTVRFAGWIRQPGNRWFDAERSYANTEIRVKVEDPTGRIISNQIYQPDEFGAFSGEFPLDLDIALGTCLITLESKGALTTPAAPNPFGDPFARPAWSLLNTWRVQVGEFRTPDFRVEVTPEPRADDGTIGAVVRALYNSGEPMIGAEVIGEMKADPTSAILFPKSDFDWSYGVGYDWPLPESRWMPEWKQWGIRHLLLGEDETESSFIDANSITRLATGVTDENGEARLSFHGNLTLLKTTAYDCRIRAAVTEHSGRIMTGSNSFIETGHPVSLFIRPDKGFYQIGEEVALTLYSMDPERAPIPVNGTLHIERIQYEENTRTPIYQPLTKLAVAIDGDGIAEHRFTPPSPGQYRMMFRSGETRRGIVLNILADGDEARDLRFNPIQLTPDRTVCDAGDTLEVAIHCDLADAHVWLFQVMPNGKRRAPRMIRLDGKVARVSIPITSACAPNFHLLAMTVHGGRLHQARCWISIPPRENLLAVALTTTTEKPTPGGPLDVAVNVRDHTGNPVAASLAIATFDRALEDLAGPLPQTRKLLPHPFAPHWGENPLQAAGHATDDFSSAFPDFHELGCFSYRSGLSGTVRRTKDSRFTKLGEELWVGYEPPELPSSSASSFPITPASPVTRTYSRPAAVGIGLSDEDADALQNTTARSRIADHAYWGASIRTDAEGRAKLSFPLPENLTSWKTQAWAFGQGNQFGDAELETPASKPLQIRPVLPRSAVHGDRLEISATIRNLSAQAAEIHLLLEVRNLATHLPDGKAETKTVTLPAAGEGIVSWPVGLHAAGTAAFRFVARSADGTLTDGTELPLVVAPRTTPRVAAAIGRVHAGEKSASLTLDLPPLQQDTPLKVRLSAQPALDAFAAIPQLVSYPFGCTEQTLNRFLPLLIASKTIDNTGIDWEEMMKHLAVPDHSLGWIRGAPLHRSEPAMEPLTREKCDILILAGMKRLDEMADESERGSWSWFQGGQPSPYLTAMVVRGLGVARRFGYKLSDGGNAANEVSTWWLESHVRSRIHTLSLPNAKLHPDDAFITHVLSQTDKQSHHPLREILIQRSDELPLSGKIFLALSLDPTEHADPLNRLLPTIHKSIEVLAENPAIYQQWWEDPVETRAWYLMLLTRFDPLDARISTQVEHLLAMRSNGVVWKSTRDTALCIEAIAGTLSPFFRGPDQKSEIPLQIHAAGHTESLTLNASNFWTLEVELPLEATHPATGKLDITLTRTEPSAALIHASATVKYAADAADTPTASAHSLTLDRSYFLIRKNQAPVPLTADAVLTAGDVVEVELKLHSPLPRSYVHLRDPIPAGLEPLHQLSAHAHGAYRETRLGETHFFIQTLDTWNHTFRYRCQAVTPGKSLALPSRAECMYSPAVSASSPPHTFHIRPRQ